MKKKEDLMNEKETIVENETEIIEDVYEDEDEIMAHNGKDELFAMGPTYDMLADWKSRYKEEVYRPLRRSEYKTMQRAQGTDEFYNEESVCRTCVLWPDNYANQEMAFGKAGIPTLLSQLILEQSGFTRPATVRL